MVFWTLRLYVNFINLKCFRITRSGACRDGINPSAVTDSSFIADKDLRHKLIFPSPTSFQLLIFLREENQHMQTE